MHQCFVASSLPRKRSSDEADTVELRPTPCYSKPALVAGARQFQRGRPGRCLFVSLFLYVFLKTNNPRLRQLGVSADSLRDR